MRVVDTIPHESMTITVFKMNDKFIVRFEAGLLEQAFKFHTDVVGSLEELKQRIDPEFIEGTRRRFNEMFLQMQKIF